MHYRLKNLISYFLNSRNRASLAGSQNVNQKLTEQIQTFRKLYLKSEANQIISPRKACISETKPFSGEYKIGYSYNLLNNAYIFCKIARKNGVNARLFLEPDFADIMATSLPFWEEAEYEGEETPYIDSELITNWQNPDFVSSSSWSLDHYKNVDINFDFEGLKKLIEGTAISPINDELSFLAAYSVLGHLELLKQYNEVDLLQVSGTHIGLASFTNLPYVTFPFGDDLYDIPFRNDELAWMQVRGFLNARRHIISGECFLDYCDSLNINRKKIDLLPFMIDTDDYSRLEKNQLRTELHENYSGKTIFFVGCRQNWFWKGSDKLLRAIAKLQKTHGDGFIILLVWYGQDMDQSAKLIEELGIDKVIKKIGILSKPILRKYIDASDVVIDQFTLGSLGTLALETMSMGLPLICFFDPEKHFKFETPPPLLNAFGVEEIYEKMVYCLENKDKLNHLGTENRQWLIKYHGQKNLWSAYDECYRKALTQG